MTRWILLSAGLLCAAPSLVRPVAAADKTSAEPMRIGMVSTLFNDIPPTLIDFVGGPFKALMKEFTGLDGQLKVGGDAFDVGRKLMDKNLDLAVFHGFEFGWARQKFPE